MDLKEFFFFGYAGLPGLLSLQCRGFLLQQLLLSQSSGSSTCKLQPLQRAGLVVVAGESQCAGPVVVAHGPSRLTACGIFMDQGLNLYPLNWQADSQPLHHQENLIMDFKGQLALHITGFKRNCTAKEMRLQTFSESQQNKIKKCLCLLI